jgi:putative glutamine amidotransferase
VPHRQQTPGSEPSHRVAIEPGSLLGATIGAETADVNSFHHQAIDRLGRDLVATAWAGDGTIEAVEDRSRRFLVGVQWHAELLIARPVEQALFRAFVSAAADSRAGSVGKTMQ